MPTIREFVAGPWRGVLVLGVTQIITWGSLFYPPVLTLPRLAAERGWSVTFAMAGFSVLQSMRLNDLKVLDFDPDVILCTVHVNEDVMVRRALRSSIAKGRDLNYPWLEEIVARSGARSGMSLVKIQRLIQPYLLEVMERSMRTIAETAA